MKKVIEKKIKDRLRIVSNRDITILNEITLEDGHEYTLGVAFFNDLIKRLPDFKSYIDTGVIKIVTE